MTSTEDRFAPAEPFTPEEVAVLVRAAVAAPSIHNSQPWRFHDGPDRIEVHLDPQRALPVADPSGREQTISCGAAVFNLRLAMIHLGNHPVVEVSAGGGGTLLATVRRGAPRQPTPLEARLYSAVYRRRSHRRPFGGERVPAEILDELADACFTEGARLDEVVAAPDRLALVDLSAAAAEWLLGDPGYRGELARWTRHDTRRDDGVRLDILGDDPYPVNGLPWALMADPQVAVGELVRHPMLVIGTDDDSPASWLRAGQALQRLLLTVSARGLAASLFTQVLEVSATRAALAERLDLPGQPQLVLRIGYATGGVPAAPRRPLEAVFTTDDPPTT